MIGVNVCSMVGSVLSTKGLRSTRTGKEIFDFTLGVQGATMKSGEPGKVMKVNVTAWDKYAVSLSRWIVEGLPVHVLGRLVVNRYQKEGAWQTDVSISASSVVSLEDGGTGGGWSGQAAGTGQEAGGVGSSTGGAPEEPFPDLP